MRSDVKSRASSLELSVLKDENEIDSFASLGSYPASQVSTEVTGTVSEALVEFRQQCMEHLSTYMSSKNGAVAPGVNANVDAFADDEEVEVEEDNVDKFLKGRNKKQKT